MSRHVEENGDGSEKKLDVIDREEYERMRNEIKMRKEAK